MQLGVWSYDQREFRILQRVRMNTEWSLLEQTTLLEIAYYLNNIKERLIITWNSIIKRKGINGDLGYLRVHIIYLCLNRNLFNLF